MTITEREPVLCTDGAPVYRRYAQDRGVVHEPINLAQGVRVRRPAFHVQNVDAYHSRWKGWMERFHGVATRYLDHYIGWHRMIDALGKELTPHGIQAAASGHPYQHSTVTWPTQSFIVHHQRGFEDGFTNCAALQDCSCPPTRR